METMNENPVELDFLDVVFGKRSIFIRRAITSQHQVVCGVNWPEPLLVERVNNGTVYLYSGAPATFFISFPFYTGGISPRDLGIASTLIVFYSLRSVSNFEKHFELLIRYCSHLEGFNLIDQIFNFFKR